VESTENNKIDRKKRNQREETESTGGTVIDWNKGNRWEGAGSSTKDWAENIENH
jgi:hypothetical protein